MGELFVVGISWRTAPVAVRERLAYPSDEIVGAITRLRACGNISEAMLLSTCNRVEIYGVAHGHAASAAQATQGFLLSDRAVVGDDDAVARALYQHHGGAAVRHVFRVASALDSLVLGEAQILGQLKDAYGQAQAASATGPILGRWIERAFGVAKRTRTETTISRGSSNISSVAVELASRVFGDLQGRRVLVLGAGKMSTLAARHLRRAGVAELIVSNRSPERAEALAAQLSATARPWEDLETLLSQADVVISSTGAREPILTSKLMRRVAKNRRYRPLVLIDIAVPRDAEPSVTDAEGVYLFDIDDLERVVAANLAERAKAAGAADAIVNDEVMQFEQWQRSHGVVPTIRALREHFTGVAESEVKRTLETLSRREHSPTERDDVIRRMSQRLVGKLLHQPQAHLKTVPADQIATYIETVQGLFDLSGKPDEAAPEAAEEVADERLPLRLASTNEENS